MDGYAVKAGELGKLIDDLGTAADRMADANRKLGGGGVFGSLGTAELGRAGVEFEEAWGYGIGRLGEAASEISERLKQAKQKYERIEAEFGDELAKFGSAVLGGGSTGADGKVGGGVTGGVPGIDDLAGREGQTGIGDLGMGHARPAGGVPGSGGLGSGSDGGMVGGATGGITDLLNGLDR